MEEIHVTHMEQKHTSYWFQILPALPDETRHRQTVLSQYLKNPEDMRFMDWLSGGLTLPQQCRSLTAVKWKVLKEESAVNVIISTT